MPEQNGSLSNGDGCMIFWACYGGIHHKGGCGKVGADVAGDEFLVAVRVRRLNF